MSLKPRLKQQLEFARSATERMLAVFKTPQDWTFQVHPAANHALWVAGHLGTVDNFYLSAVAPAEVQMPAGYREKFGMGSRPAGSPDAYPPVAEVLDFFRQRRAALLRTLDGLSEQSLLTAAPAGAPPFIRDVAGFFEAAVWHEGLHAGQITIARRALGHPPMVGPV